VSLLKFRKKKLLPPHVIKKKKNSKKNSRESAISHPKKELEQQSPCNLLLAEPIKKISHVAPVDKGAGGELGEGAGGELREPEGNLDLEDPEGNLEGAGGELGGELGEVAGGGAWNRKEEVRGEK
jgi:hypothetical protein